jgi:hypothetical protein
MLYYLEDKQLPQRSSQTVLQEWHFDTGMLRDEVDSSLEL